MSRRPAPDRKNAGPRRRARTYTRAAPPTLAIQVTQNTVMALIVPRPERKAASVMMTSAGAGGKKFSTTAASMTIPYTATGGQAARRVRSSSIRSAGLPYRGHRDHGQPFPASDEAHAFVALGLDTHIRRIDAEHARERRPHVRRVGTDPGLLRDNREIGLQRSPAPLADVLHRNVQQVEGIGVLPPRLTGRKESPDIARPGRAK